MSWENDSLISQQFSFLIGSDAELGSPDRAALGRVGDALDTDGRAAAVDQGVDPQLPPIAWCNPARRKAKQAARHQTGRRGRN